MSCHAWLLWKPESLCYIGRILLQLQLTKKGGGQSIYNILLVIINMSVRFVDEENTTSINSFRELPLLNGQPKMSVDVRVIPLKSYVFIDYLLYVIHLSISLFYLSIHQSIMSVVITLLY